MLPADLSTYGGPFSNGVPTQDASTEMDAAYANKLMEDAAQLTRPPCKAHFSFTTASGNGVRTASGVFTLWGNGASYAPTITRTGTGVYTIVWPASFVDGLGVTESLSFARAHASISSSTVVGFAHLVGSGTSWTLYGLSTVAAASDLTAGTTLDVWFY
jgi:hypothetical protein